MTEGEKLKACPFCGSADVEMRESITDAMIACNNCGCRTGVGYLGASDAANAAIKRAVANVWNTRTPTATPSDEVVRLREENEALRHWSVNHIDALLLYAAGLYPNDSHVKEAVEFCRIVQPDRTLRMDKPEKLKGSGFHPASAALSAIEGEKK